MLLHTFLKKHPEDRPLIEEVLGHKIVENWVNHELGARHFTGYTVTVDYPSYVYRKKEFKINTHFNKKILTICYK